MGCVWLFTQATNSAFVDVCLQLFTLATVLRLNMRLFLYSGNLSPKGQKGLSLDSVPQLVTANCAQVCSFPPGSLPRWACTEGPWKVWYDGNCHPLDLSHSPSLCSLPPKTDRSGGEAGSWPRLSPDFVLSILPGLGEELVPCFRVPHSG